MAGSITVQSSSINFPPGTVSASLIEGPVVFSITTPAIQVNSLTFGSATFISTTGPTGATTCLVLPPTNNLIGLTLKGITGDTGIALNPAGPISAFLTFPSNTTPTVGLTSAAAINGTVTLIWA